MSLPNLYESLDRMEPSNAAPLARESRLSGKSESYFKGPPVHLRSMTLDGPTHARKWERTFGFRVVKSPCGLAVGPLTGSESKMKSMIWNSKA